MNNEPVAWIAVGDNTSVFFDLDCALAIDDNPTPLYTHPHSEESVKVKELDEQYEKGFKAGKEEGWKAHKFHHPVKELTDEEIAGVFDECYQNNRGADVVTTTAFARAILRKAQENG